VRSHAKASTAGSTKRRASGLGRRSVLAAALSAFSALALLLLAAPAFAGTATDRPLLFSFDGSDTTAGAFTGLTRLGIDQETGSVYVMDSGHQVIDKFNPDGTAANFSGIGASSLNGSATPQGVLNLNPDADISVDNSGGANQGRLYVNSDTGPVSAFDPVGAYLWQLESSLFGEACGSAVDSEGHLWVGDFGHGGKGVEFANTGSPPAQIGEVDDTTGNPCRLNVDASGNIFFNQWLQKVDKYVGGTFASTLDSASTNDIAIDQSSASGHLFTIHNGDFNEYESSGTKVGTFGTNFISNGQGVAYNKALDRVYVSDRGSSTVKVFGPSVTGTVPDVTIGPATNLGATSATLHGTVNPQGVNNSWHFEWKRSSQSWGEAQSSPPQSLPADSSDHPVSYEATGLSPNTAYEARLVAKNTDLNLTSISAVESFDDTRPAVITLAAAPRTDTGARINALITPGNLAATYRFEFSEDGSNWTARPDHAIGASGTALVVSEELTGLHPSTTYHYRLIGENTAGPAVPQGEAKSFTTRSTAEMNPPQRGIEMVNSPDKGNQNVLARVKQGTPPMSADGERAVWNVLAGAPGGNSGAGATFLAERTADGWHSRGLTPPAEEQVGNAEEGGYALFATTPTLSSFVFLAGEALNGINGGETLVRIDANQNQTVLKEYQEEFTIGNPDLTDDGAHVLFLEKVQQAHLPAQIEDLGSGAPETVSLMPDGLPNECGLDDSAFNRSFVGGGTAPEAAARQWRPGYHMIATTDASRVYFQAKPNGSPDCATALYALYVRNRDTGETTLIDPGVAERAPQFIRATPDGRAAYFLTKSNLDPADTNSDADVYRWSEEAGQSSCLTCAVPDADVQFRKGGENPAGIVLVSDDFSHVYFESRSQLVPGKGRAGEVNIYSLSQGEIRFVVDFNDGDGSLNVGEAELSTDGKVLLMRAFGRPDVTSDEIAAGEEELFRYDERDGSVECISCRRSGLTEGRTSSFHMSADGSTAAFVTTEALVGLDVNRDLDIYEWRNGVIRLISDGVSNFPTGPSDSPEVQAVNADGRDVLFSLVDPGLTGFEQDGFANLYDARIGGGFEPPSPPAHCSEDSCQGPLRAAPTSPRPTSANFSGYGNQRSGSKQRHPCAKKRGKARRRCTRKHKRQAQKARANHNAGRAK
jgi:hypothetical protein